MSGWRRRVDLPAAFGLLLGGIALAGSAIGMFHGLWTRRGHVIIFSGRTLACGCALAALALPMIVRARCDRDGGRR